ncbi:NAD(P)H-quinone oxidoreductase subunit J [bacterium BMS3Abin05]|nr:NAD(P)H-quinone oxidoreductase subunit J [bacterium BMS3Abin05]GBE27203.1 NAD(P)H-quinone oxidoreductase subunit J [bacterium BMS3Bbin03]HDZ11646.1 NADH-quinone oxidoreductase subunit C [Bacteroidota bacterium]
MNAREIHDQIKEKFPEAILEFNDTVQQPYLKIAPQPFYNVCQFLRDDADLDFDYLMCLSGVDYGDLLGTVYHFYSMKHTHKIILKVEVPRENPAIPSICDLWRTADWHEREVYDLFGIVFLNHPDLRRLLLPEDWEGYPLRKDYVTPEFFKGIPVLHSEMKSETNEQK